MPKKRKEDMTPEELAKFTNKSEAQKESWKKRKASKKPEHEVQIIPAYDAPKFEVPKVHKVEPKVGVAIRRDLYTQLIVDVNIQATLKGEYNVHDNRLIDDITALISAAVEDYLTKHIEDYRMY